MLAIQAFQERSSTYLKDYQWDLADRVVDIGKPYAVPTPNLTGSCPMRACLKLCGTCQDQALPMTTCQGLMAADEKAPFMQPLLSLLLHVNVIAERFTLVADL